MWNIPSSWVSSASPSSYKVSSKSILDIISLSDLSSFSAALLLALLHLVLVVVVVVVVDVDVDDDYDDNDYALLHLVLGHQLPQSLRVFSLNLTPVFQVPAEEKTSARFWPIFGWWAQIFNSFSSVKYPLQVWLYPRWIWAIDYLPCLIQCNKTFPNYLGSAVPSSSASASVRVITTCKRWLWPNWPSDYDDMFFTAA